jgi:hypothetical protein
MIDDESFFADRALLAKNDLTAKKTRKKIFSVKEANKSLKF